VLCLTVAVSALLKCRQINVSLHMALYKVGVVSLLCKFLFCDCSHTSTKNIGTKEGKYESPIIVGIETGVVVHGFWFQSRDAFFLILVVLCF